MSRYWILLAVVAGVLWGSSAYAQGYYEQQGLADRLTRLEQDLRALQKSVYRGQVPPAGASGGGSGDGETVAKLQQLEEQIRQLNGQLEILRYENQQLKAALDTAIQDFDGRLNGAGAGGSPQGAAPTANGGGTLGQLPASAGEQQSSAAPASLPEGTVDQQYKAAQAMVTAEQYDNAIAMFEEFLAKHPKHELAGNAYFWLGESYYNQQKYDRAIKAYSLGGQNFPEGHKAPDTWLKIAQTLEILGKKEQACGSYTHLLTTYKKTISENIRRQAERKRALAKC